MIIKSEIVENCRRALKVLQRRIYLCWIPGHRDIIESEESNDLARRIYLMETSLGADIVCSPLCNIFIKIKIPLHIIC